MSQTPKELQEIVERNYGINASPLEELETFNLTDVKVYTRYPDQYTIENYGSFEIQRFRASDNELYKLIICSSDFPNNKELVRSMKDEEYLTVKDYELMMPIEPIEGYFLYKLIPFTVQGKPIWG